MRANWLMLALLLILFQAQAGCRNTGPELKPPPTPDEFKLPPNEVRYTKPVAYPKETLYQSPLKKNASPEEMLQNNMASRPGAPGIK